MRDMAPSSGINLAVILHEEFCVLRSMLTLFMGFARNFQGNPFLSVGLSP